MPVFDWSHSDLAQPLADGSIALAYEQSKVDKIDLERIAETITAGSCGRSLPDWEPERTPSAPSPPSACIPQKYRGTRLPNQK
jgi:D-mannonate dehydratase